MKKQTADLTHGNLPKQILFFSFPLIASNLLQVLFHMSDLAVVGRFSADGANALGSGVFRLVWLVTVFLYFRTIESIYLLYIFSWTVTAIAEIVYFRRIYKKTALAL